MLINLSIICTHVCKHAVVFQLFFVGVNNKELRIPLIPCMLCLIFMLCSVVCLSSVKSLEEHNEAMKNSVVEEPIINKVHLAILKFIRPYIIMVFFF